MPDKLERIVKFDAAFDKRHADPKKNYGVHGVEIRFVVKGPAGATQFVVFTNWQLPHVRKEQEARPEADPQFRHLFCRPMAADLGYHSPKPIYQGQKAMPNCQYLGGKECYYDGSGLRARDAFRRLLEQGEEGVWEALESEYRCVLENGGVHRRECLCAKSDLGNEVEA